MTLVYPEISKVFDTTEGKLNTIVIENQPLLLSLLSDITAQLGGLDGETVISDGRKTLPLSKNLELLDQFVPFELNRKQLLNKLNASLGGQAVSDESYLRTVQLLGEVERYMMDISFDLNCDIDFTGIDIQSLIKATAPSFREDYDSLGEKIIDYFELVTEFDRKKLFLTLNLRSYIGDEEAQRFLDTALAHEYNVIMIESSEHPLLENEARFIVDSSLCEIC